MRDATDSPQALPVCLNSFYRKIFSLVDPIKFAVKLGSVDLGGDAKLL